MKYILALLFVVLLLACSTPTPITTAPSEEPLRGVALSPKSFSATDFPRFFDIIEPLDIVTGGDDAESIMTPNTAGIAVMGLSKQFKFIPVILVGVGADTSTDEILAFVNTYHPPYLGIGNEINFEKKGDIIANVNRINAQVKLANPATQTFTVYQYETLLGRHDGVWGGKKTEPDWTLLDNVQTDFIAFTTYPGLIYQNPEDVPDNYYSQIAKHTSKKIAFTETGWFRDGPTGWDSSAEEQGRFAARFLELTAPLHPVFLIWSYLYDQLIPEPFATMGLLKDTETSPAFKVWMS